MSSHLGQSGIPGHIRNISEAARGHSPKAVGALAGSGGGLLTLPRDGIIANRGGEVSHVFVRGGQIIDPFTRGINQLSGWVESGSVPRVGPSVPGGCDGRYLVEGIGPFSGTNYFTLGSGADVLDFAGDFSVCVLISPSATAGQYVFSNENGSTLGYVLYMPLVPNQANFFSRAANAGVQTNNSVVASVPNVVCFGRVGGVSLVKLNQGTTFSAAMAFTPDTVDPAILGGLVRWGGLIYEAWFSILTPSNALFTSIALEVKGRLGVTAW